ncbi:MAG: monooxygenase, partial [Alphaproteobacteria bacterium]
MRDVVIVGGGPVGLGLAIELTQRGAAVTVIERNVAIPPIPKGQNLTQRTMESFAAWGAEEALRAARLLPPGHARGGLVCYGRILSEWCYEWLPRERVRPYYHTDNERLPQYATEAVLRARAAALGIDLRLGVTATGLAPDEEGVTVATDAGPVRGRYVAGCDGSRSMVREAAGITETRRDHDRLMVLVVFRSPELHRILSVHPPRSFYNALAPELDGYWRFLGRVDADTTWFFHAPVPQGTTAATLDLGGLLAAAVGKAFPFELIHLGFWDLRIAVADRWRAGRIFIAGDAAHSHPPYGGYGINTGFEDARNLGWKLAAVLQGWGGPALLDSYDAERRPVFISTARDFIERFIEEDRAFLRRFSPERDRAAFAAAWAARNAGAEEVVAFEPHYEGSPIVPGSRGTPSAQGRHDFAARAGHHMAPMTLPDGRGLHQALGSGLTLLALDADPAPWAEAARALGLPLTVLAAPRSGEAARYGAGLVLIRPDLYAAWAGEADDPAARDPA